MKVSIQSIKDKLKNYSKRQDKNHQLILTRYFQERLLYRLSISPFRENFLLKGGALVYCWNQDESRPTIDIDFLAKNVKIDEKQAKDIFTKICQINYVDGVVFNTKQITVSPIIKDGDYKGTRIKIPTRLGNIQQTLQIDIGVGDVVTPKPVELKYPILLDFEEPIILAYSVETLVAEKFQAMIALGNYNSRMKDFYDLYTILNQEGNYSEDTLKTAIQNTFVNRKTDFVPNPILFQNNFYQNERRLIQWKAFLRKSHLDQAITFEMVMAVIKEKLMPIHELLQSKT